MKQAGIRRAEIVATFSYATDFATGRPMESAFKSCVLSMRIGSALGLDREALREIYNHSLLRYIGCNAETDVMSALFGDEIEFRRALSPLDMGNPMEFAPTLLRAIVQAQSGQSFGTLIWKVLKNLAASKSVTLSGFQAHCETAERFARRLGFDEALVQTLSHFPERWDGKGLPKGLKGDAIALAARVVTLAQDVIVLSEMHGSAAALPIIKRRSGKLYDPRLTDTFLARADEWLKGIDSQSSWDHVLALEPEPQTRLSETEFEEACLAMADFTDIKSPFTIGHSRAVAKLAAAAGRRCGLPETDVITLRRAALLHDIGQAAISSGIFAKSTPLTETEREKIRLHPYNTERILARSDALARLAEVASRHHERLDGSGYHRGLRGDGLSPMTKLLAAAEVYQALIEARPHRPVLTAEQAATTLKSEVRAGRLDSEAVNAILEAAGHRVTAVRRELVGGLTAREMGVLRLVARGRTLKEIGQALGISPKTADNHIQNLYAKIGVRTRAGATLFAIEHGLNE